MYRNISGVSDAHLMRLLLRHLSRAIDAAGRSGSRTTEGRLVELLIEFSPALPTDFEHYEVGEVIREAEIRRGKRSLKRYEKRMEDERKRRGIGE